MNEPTPRRLMDKQGVADVLGVTTRTIDRMIVSRSIPFLRLPTGNGANSKIRFDSLEIDAWLKRLNEPTAATQTGNAASPRERALELMME